MSVSDAWLAQHQEDALEPELPLSDPHHHLWDYPDDRYLLDELLADLGGGHRVLSTVFVECGAGYRQTGPAHLRPLGETEFVQNLVAAGERDRETRVAAGLVGFANLCHPAVDDLLRAHLAASPNRFRGIRQAAGWHQDAGIRNSRSEPPQGLFLRDDFRRGFRLLARHQLVFDAWFYHTQFDDFISLARDFPEVRMVLDHFGGPLGVGPYAGPGRRDAVFTDWRKKLEELAACPNVFAKLGGINMKINGFGWHKRRTPPSSDELVEATGRYYHWVIEQFGAHRCMFESNFPVDKASCSYTVLWNAFKKISSDYASEERALLLHDTACRVYRLESPARSPDNGA